MMRYLAILAILILSASGTTQPPTSFVYVPAVTVNVVTYSPLKGVGLDARSGVNLNCGDSASVGAGWWHNWSPSARGCASPGFVATVYSAAFLGQPAGGSGPMFGYNEPDRPDQANVTAAQAAQATAQMLTLYPGRPIIGATISHLGRAMYYPAYLAELDRLGVSGRLHGLSLNCYLSVPDCQAYVNQVRGWASQRGIPTVWLKEFRLDDVSQGQTMIEWLEANGIYYAWFISRLPADQTRAGLWSAPLFDGAGQLTPHGTMYRAQ
ncbi:MAG: hypothetical protein EHM35_00670 [Planctomycetaceae bacterium]|nr:MAG: hypothetical protein EHM35_00670 [Planctomycetaceae bacterium]